MKVQVSKLKDKMSEVLLRAGYSKADIPFIINMYLGGELRGHTCHGLASFPGFVSKEFSSDREPIIMKETQSLFMIDANAQSGNVVGRRAADEAIKRAEKSGVGTAIVKNMESWLRPGAVAEYISEKGYVAIVINNGGEAAVAPPGGFDPVTGTNPIAYGIPTENGSLVVDMATSKRAKGQIRLANKYGTDLPPNSFYDANGEVTVDPKAAYSIMPFGEYKGFSLALLVEILCGSLVGMPMLNQGDPSNNNFGGKTPKRGGLIFVVDPKMTTDADTFTQVNSDYIEKIKSTRPRKGEQIRIPGEEAAKEQNSKITDDEIEIPDEIWEELKGL